jgi:hypothetical protein
MLNDSFPKVVRFVRYCEKYSTAGQVTDGNIIRCMRCACWIPKVLDIYSEYVISIVFYGNSG